MRAIHMTASSMSIQFADDVSVLLIDFQSTGGMLKYACRPSHVRLATRPSHVHGPTVALRPARPTPRLSQRGRLVVCATIVFTALFPVLSLHFFFSVNCVCRNLRVLTMFFFFFCSRRLQCAHPLQLWPFSFLAGTCVFDSLLLGTNS